MTNPTKINAVCNGVVKLKFLKYTRDISIKMIGAAMAWMIKAVFKDVTTMPMPIAAKHRSQPTNANDNIIRIFRILISISRKLLVLLRVEASK